MTSWGKFKDSKIIRVCNDLQRNNGSRAIYILKSDLENVNKHMPRNNLLLAVEHVIYLLYSICKFRSAKPTRLGLELEAYIVPICSLPSMHSPAWGFYKTGSSLNPLWQCAGSCLLFVVQLLHVSQSHKMIFPLLQFQWQGSSSLCLLPSLPRYYKQHLFITQRYLPAQNYWEVVPLLK